MTEAEWLTGTDLARHLQFVEGRLSPRKSRLLAAALCRQAWSLHTHFDIRIAIEKAEEFADGDLHPLEPLETYRQACREAAVRFHETWTRWVGAQNPAEELRWWLLHELAWAAAFTASAHVPIVQVGQRVAAALVQSRTGGSGVLQAHRPDQAVERDRITADVNATLRTLVFDVVGNPFAPVAFDPAWRTSTAVGVANQIYDSRDFGAMPILADALQDAGCDNEDVLNHCRDAGPHARGCWVVDGVLGKA
jgi:hypothetical protein